jgi:hypothetical protein
LLLNPTKGLEPAKSKMSAIECEASSLVLQMQKQGTQQGQTRGLTPTISSNPFVNLKFLSCDITKDRAKFIIHLLGCICLLQSHSHEILFLEHYTKEGPFNNFHAGFYSQQPSVSIIP